jgi:hypothetical protein
MTIEFKLWVVNIFQESSPITMRIILRVLKFYPDALRAVLAEDLDDWAELYTSQTEETVNLDNPSKEVEEIIDALKERFAEELKTITK